jgi:hypothetical protein
MKYSNFHFVFFIALMFLTSTTLIAHDSTSNSCSNSCSSSGNDIIYVNPSNPPGTMTNNDNDVTKPISAPIAIDNPSTNSSNNNGYTNIIGTPKSTPLPNNNSGVGGFWGGSTTSTSNTSTRGINFGTKNLKNPGSTSNRPHSFIMGMVTASTLNIRRSPWGQICAVIYRGDIVKVIGTSVDNRWYKIEFLNVPSKFAYVYKRYITFNPSSNSNISSNTQNNTNNVASNFNNNNNNVSTSFKTGYTTASTLNVRLSPWGTIIGKLPYQSKVSIIGRQGKWYKISYRGTRAFVYAKYVRIGTPSAPKPGASVAGNAKLGDKLASIAKSYIGSTQFRGRDVAGGKLACAKFVSTVLHDAGVMNVVLNVRSLVKILKSKGWVEVSPPPWKKGDVVTWKTYDYTGDGIKDPDTHVGIVDVVSGSGARAISNSSSKRYPRETSVHYCPISRVLRPPTA